MSNERKIKKNEMFGDTYVELITYDENGDRSKELVNILDLDKESHLKFLNFMEKLKKLYEMIMGK